MKLFLKALFILFLCALMLAAAHFWHFKQVKTAGKEASFSDPIQVFLVSQGLSVIEGLLGEMSDFESADFVDRDIGLYLVRSWDMLDASGLRKLCGKPCYDEGVLTYSINVNHENLSSVTKDIFINLSPLTEVDGNTMNFPSERLECLRQFLQQEIKFYVPEEHSGVADCMNQFSLSFIKEHHGGATKLHVVRNIGSSFSF